MRVIGSFVFLSAILFLTSALFLVNEESPEKLLLGKWEEVSWEYEKVNHGGDTSRLRIADWQTDQTFIHKAEIWQFNSSRDLLLISANQNQERVTWNIKGRGHILELQHANGFEDYQIQEITEDSLVIHFSFDLQVRGIVKMTFKRLEEEAYAEKI